MANNLVENLILACC